MTTRRCVTYCRLESVPCIPCKMKYWGIYFGGLADFSATADIESAINLATGYVDVITHVDQASYGHGDGGTSCG